MVYERYTRGQRDAQDYAPDSRDTYSSARDYEAAGYYDRGRGNRGWNERADYGRTGWNDRGQGWNQSFGQRDYGRDYDQRGYGQGTYGHRDYGQRDYGRGDQYRYGAYGDYGRQQGDTYRGSYASDGHPFTDVDDYGRGTAYRRDYGRTGYGRQPQGYDYQERGFLSRAGDEVRSWFGDEDAERRREADARYDQRYDRDSDSDYGTWRRGQIAALDRDYDEYRAENRNKFQNEFSSWRNERQTQRDALSSVSEHMEVLGSDGSHVGTVDCVRGDRIVLTKSDQDAEGRHHSIPSRWIETVDEKVTLRKTADEAQSEWRDEERNTATFGDRNRGDREIGDDRGGYMLNRSFSGTY